MSFELVMAKRDRFGRKSGESVSILSADARDLASFVEKQATRGKSEEKAQEILSDLFEQEPEDD